MGHDGKMNELSRMKKIRSN